MSINIDIIENNTKQSFNRWPIDGLEMLAHCPVCGGEDRKILHSELVDNVFCVAPGKWNLWECISCRSAYLDPRPTPKFIHFAYAKYFTHTEAATEVDYSLLSKYRKFRRRLANGYVTWRYSSQNSKPASAFGVVAALFMPKLRNALDRRYRNLPKLPRDGGRLLDVGCGNGSFLKLARDCGWEVVGLDPDPKAVHNASGLGLTVYEGGIEFFDGKSELFDVVTLNHVIEHVHNPIEVLTACHVLLRPGGQLWIETPNIDSLGHALFQKNWFDLDPPRHLVLFNRRSLHRAIVSAGFTSFRYHARPNPCMDRFKSCFAMECGLSGLQQMKMSKVMWLQTKLVIFTEWLISTRREFLTVSASKAEK